MPWRLKEFPFIMELFGRFAEMRSRRRCIMLSGNRKISLFLALVAFGFLGACSSSPTGSEDVGSDIGAAESGADAVGSIPEDMLAAEESTGGDEFTAEATPTPVEQMAPTESDPFADLKESESSDDLASLEESMATTGETATYSVKAGDTLMKIAFTIYGDVDRWKDLKEWNSGKLKSVSQLSVGTKLKYETPVNSFSPEQLAHSYLIKKGDTLAGIADEVYGRKMKYRKLQNYNRRLIKNPNRIFAGFTIFYDITDQEMAEAEARRKERMAAGGSDSSGDSFNLVPSTISPPAEAVPSPKPIAIAPPTGGAVPVPAPGNVVPAPASTAK
jgi:LysM repeat protein